MKKLLAFTAVSFLLSFSAHAQVAKTKWSGSMNLPGQDGSLSPADVEWDFGKDTLTVQITGGEPEVFTFKDVKKVLTLMKVSGGSQCPQGATITATYTIVHDVFTITKQTSDCDMYNKVASSQPLKKMK